MGTPYVTEKPVKQRVADETRAAMNGSRILTNANNLQSAQILAKQTRDAYVASGALASAAPALHVGMNERQLFEAAAKTKALHYQYKPDHAAAHYGTTDATAMPAKNDFAARGLNPDGSVPVSDTPQGPIAQAAAPTPGTVGQSNLQKAFPGWDAMKPSERTEALRSKLGQGFNGNNAATQQRAGVFDLLQSDGGVIRDGRIVKPNSNTSAAPTLASIEARYGNGTRGTYTPAPASPLAQAAAPVGQTGSFSQPIQLGIAPAPSPQGSASTMKLNTPTSLSTPIAPLASAAAPVTTPTQSTPPVAPVPIPSTAGMAGALARNAVGGALTSAGNWARDNIVAPVANTAASAIDFGKGLAGNLTPTPRVKVSPQTGLPFSPNSTDAIGTRTAPKDDPATAAPAPTETPEQIAERKRKAAMAAASAS